jgi:hypothetical protein
MRYGLALPNGGAWAEAGATWWLEYVSSEIGDLAAVRAAIARGPLRAV